MAPSVAVMPGSNKPFEVFVREDVLCRQYASSAVAGQAEQPNNQAAGSAAVETIFDANGSPEARLSIQQQYDNAYASCMLSKGNLVAGYEPPPPYLPPPPMLTPPPPQYDHGLVLRIQAELVRIGLLNGPPDGAYGPKTRGAILDYEKLQGLPRDGIPSPGLLENLRHQ